MIFIQIIVLNAPGQHVISMIKIYPIHVGYVHLFVHVIYQHC